MGSELSEQYFDSGSRRTRRLCLRGMINSFLSLSLMCSMVSLQANQMSAKTYLYLTCLLWVRAVRLSLTTSFTSTSAFLLSRPVFGSVYLMGFLMGLRNKGMFPL